MITRLYKTVLVIGACLCIYTNFYAQTLTGPNDDFDGDGILNINDVDDDNDGILDAVEDANCVIFVEDFGFGSYPGAALSGTATTEFIYNSDPAGSVYPDGLQDGEYTIAPLASDANGDWAFIPDHTSENGSGYAFVVNASVEPSEFYKNTVNVQQNTMHTLSAWITNTNDINTETGCIACCSSFALPDVTIEVRDASSGVVLGSITTGILPIATPTNNWNNYYLTFDTGTSTVIDIVFINNGPGGCGNDLAIDDIALAEEPLVTNCDIDGDGLPNSMDLDADNDGIYDIVEAGQVDANNNGYPDDMADLDGDGLVDIYDPVCTDVMVTTVTVNPLIVIENGGYLNPGFGTGPTGLTDTDFANGGLGEAYVIYDMAQVVAAGQDIDFYVGSAAGSQYIQFHAMDAAGNEIGYFGGANAPAGPVAMTYEAPVDVRYIRVRSWSGLVQFFGAEFSGSTTTELDCSGVEIFPTETTSGTPDYLNPDSDGDGCGDAIEAGFLDNDIDGFLGTSPVTVDLTNGVVTGQGGYTGTTAAVTDASLSDCGNSIISEEDFNNTPFDVPVNGSVATNDSDPQGDVLTFMALGAAGGMPVTDGFVTFNANGTYTYTPAPGFVGETEFDYVVCDDGNPILCDSSTLYIEVLPNVDPENLLVIANPDANTVLEDQSGTGNVLSNDLDPDAINPTVTTPIVAMTVAGIDEDGNPVANAGALTLNPDGTYLFTPATGFVGMVTQPYTICDAGIPATCDDTQLVIDVIKSTSNSTFANDDACITDVGVMVPGNLLANDLDSELDSTLVSDFLVDTDGDGVGDLFSVPGTPVQVGGFDDQGLFVANAGTMLLNADGTYEFTPALEFVGNLNIPYTKCDNAISQACDEATLVITILDVRRDYGDGPNTYPIAYHRALIDSDDDNELDGASNVWLGQNTTFESSQQFDGGAAADASDDAIVFGSGPGEFPLLAAPNTTYNIDVTVNSTNPDLVHYGMWIDWDNDGIYDDFYNGSQSTASPTTASVPVTTPGNAGINPVNIRLRADDDPFGESDFDGGRTNGEVEDFQPQVALPTELTYFTVGTEDCTAQLSWASASENNFKHYEIQRCSNNKLDFETIQVVAGSGNQSTAAEYSYKEFLVGDQNYYRLKMVGNDNTVQFSDIQILEVSCLKEIDFTLYPNPVQLEQEVLTIEYYGISSKENFIITDMLGRMVRSVTFDAVEQELNKVFFQVTGLVPGSYIVKSRYSNISATLIVR